MKTIPTEKDWRSEPWCLDVPIAYEHFAGKTQAEGQKLFESDYLFYQEDMLFMPVLCLGYYIHSYVNYLLSEASKGDSDNASCFFGLMECRHKDIARFDAETVSSVRRVLNRLAENQSWYDADEDIYGDFRQHAEQSLRRLG